MEAGSVCYQEISKKMVMSTLSLLGAIVLGLSALVKLPILGTPVPITLQTFALLTMAGMLTRYYAIQMVLWYIALGIVGIPFFANGAGLTYLTGATGGYLLGFIFAAILVGFFGSRQKTWISGIGIYMLAALCIYLPGIFQLKMVTQSTWSNALLMGFYPFILFDVIKAIAAYLGVRGTRKILRNV